MFLVCLVNQQVGDNVWWAEITKKKEKNYPELNKKKKNVLNGETILYTNTPFSSTAIMIPENI